MAVGTLAVALAALVLDRTVFRMSPLGPQTAVAALSPTSAQQSDGVEKEAPRASAPSSLVAEHLRKVRDRVLSAAANERDAFDPGPVFGRAVPEPGAASTETTAGQKFAQTHQLVSVLITGTSNGRPGLQAATIGEKTVTTGQDIDGGRLVAVECRAGGKIVAVLDLDGERAELTMLLPAKQQFLTHKVHAVFCPRGMDPGERIAIIDGGRQLQIGDVLDGYTLQAINPGSVELGTEKEAPSAVFEADGKLVKLCVPRAR